MTVTNDGATILKAIGVDNPAAKVLVGEFLKAWYFLVRNSIMEFLFVLRKVFLKYREKLKGGGAEILK